jgi:uncharacterized membrane protein YeaQ/YmgE (transglycosylase-associated protein family)
MDLGTSGAAMQWVVAVVGAVILIAILKALKIFR